MTAPRLHVITATQSPLAVVLRRGPSQHVASLLWDRETGEIGLGQWLRGRIYEHRSDLSPDGQHMIYFAMKGGQAYTVISRTPWLHAIAFFPQDSTWHGGGAFTAGGRVFLNGGGTLPAGADGLLQAPTDAYPHGTDGFHMGDLYAEMQVARGWNKAGGSGYAARLTRPIDTDWSLELAFQTGRKGRAIVSNVYALLGPDGNRLAQPDWEWADIWQDGLHVAARGALHHLRLSPDGSVGTPRVIQDFSGMTFEACRAPYDESEDVAPPAPQHRGPS